MAHAESAALLGNAQEAAAYQEKALNLMSEHAVTQAMLDAQVSPGVFNGVSVIRIAADELPSPYGLEHAYGILRIARTLGGYGLVTRWQGSRLPTQVDIAIGDAAPFRRLALGLAAICSVSDAVRSGSRLERASFIRGFWDGCATAAAARVAQYESAQGTQGTLVPVRDYAKETLTATVASDGPVRHRKTPPSARTYVDGRRMGRDTYQTFGRTLSDTKA
jgi:hypothetical protein